MLKQFAKYGSSEGERERERWEHCHPSWQEDIASTTTMPILLLKIKSGKYYNDYCSLGNAENVEFFKRFMLHTIILQYTEKNTT